MASQEMRFSLNERTPGAIKSSGGVSGTSVTVEDAAAVQSVLDTIHNTKAENHSGAIDWYVTKSHGPNLVRPSRQSLKGPKSLPLNFILNRLLQRCFSVDGATLLLSCFFTMRCVENFSISR